jgi:DNA repair exonuclease SbcCD ATPase subunit
MLKSWLKNLAEFDKLCSDLESAKNNAEKETAKAEKRIELIDDRREKCDTAVIILKDFLGTVTKEVIELFENTVTAGLQEIFNETYQFKMEIETQRNRKICRYMIKHSGCKNFVEINSQGSALKEVISVIIRVILVSLDTTVANVLVLDEPFGGAENSRKESIAEFLQKVCKEFNVQIIMVTHSEIFEDYADTVTVL